MKKYLYPIYKLEKENYIKWWLYNYLGKFGYVLSDILTGTEFYLDDSVNKKFNKFDIIGRTIQDGTPTPDNPIEIKNAGTNGTINEKIQNKNLCKLENTGLFPNSSGVVISQSKTFSLIVNVKNQTNLSVTGNFTLLDNNLIRVGGYSEYPILGSTGTRLNSFNSTNKTLNVTGYNYILLSFYAPGQGITIDQVNDAFQVEYGNPTDYTAHAEQNLPINLKSKNLFNKTNPYTNNWYNDEGVEQTSTITGHLANNIKVKPNTQYTISGYLIVPDFEYANFTRIYFYDKDGNWISRSANITTENSYTFTTPNNCEYINFQLYNNIVAYPRQVYSKSLDTFMLEQGSTATDYEPYWSYELCKIGTAEDYFYKENDKWYLHKEIGKFNLDNADYWNYNTPGGFYCLNFTSDNGFVSGIGLCNILEYSTTTWVINCFGITAEGILWINTGDTSLRNNEQAKTWLSSKNAIMYGVLATPTNTEITETELITQLEALQKAKTYKPVTHISSTDEVPANLKIQYYKEG